MLLFSLFTFQVVSGHFGCKDFKSIYERAKTSDAGTTKACNRLASWLREPHDIGYRPPRPSKEKYLSCREADVFTETAKLLSVKNVSQLTSFGDYEICLGRSSKTVKSHPKYRAIDGYDNNLKNPYWGASKSPFKRGSQRKLTTMEFTR